MNKLPKARTDNIVTQDLNDEILIYDRTTDRMLCLNETSAKVFNACDGVTTFAELKAKYQLTDEIIFLTLDELKKNDLLAGEYKSPFAGISRREAVRKAGLASMIALPLIAGITAPQASQAASEEITCVGQPCSDLGQCAPPCAACMGTGNCSVGGAVCPSLGSSCNGTVTGTCDAIGGGLGRCSVGSRFVCFTPGGTCSDLAVGTCIGTGMCV